MSSDRIPNTRHEAAELFTKYRNSKDAQIPWYAVVYIPPAFREQHPEIYRALQDGFEELSQNQALSQRLFKAIVQNTNRDHPIDITSNNAMSSPVSYMGPLVGKEELIIAPEAFDRFFLQSKNSEMRLKLEMGVSRLPISAILAHELDHAQRMHRDQSTRASLPKSLVEALKYRACEEATAMMAEREQIDFLRRSGDPMHQDLTARDTYSNIDGQIEALARRSDAFKRNIQEQGTKHPIVQALMLGSIINLGCMGEDATAQKQRAIDTLIRKLNDRLKLDLTPPKVTEEDFFVPPQSPPPSGPSLRKASVERDRGDRQIL